jgi:hypothetical protein
LARGVELRHLSGGADHVAGKRIEGDLRHRYAKGGYWMKEVLSWALSVAGTPPK